MTRKKIFFISLILFLVFFILINKKSQACDYIPPSIVINTEINKDLISETKTCIDDNCVYILRFNKNDWGFDNYTIAKTNVKINNTLQEIEIAELNINRNIVKINNYFDRVLENKEDKDEFLEFLSNLVIDDISAIKPIFFKEIERWRSDKNNIYYSDIYFKPYSIKEEDNYIVENNKLFNCRQVEYKRVDDWLISYYKIPSYCYFVASSGISCPVINISFFKLFLHSITNINKTTLTFLFIFLTLVLALIFLFIYLIKKKDLLFFLKPRLFKIIALVIFYILSFLIFPSIVFLSFFNLIYGLYSLIIIYLIISLVDYIKKKKFK